MDRFFSQKYCDRCGGSLAEGRIMSMINMDCLCIACKEKEKLRTDYQTAVNTELEEVKKGNFNYKGIEGDKK